MKEKAYYENVNVKNEVKLRKLLEQLPDFCKQFFIGIEPTTSSRTRIAYAYDIGCFFDYLCDVNPICQKDVYKRQDLDSALNESLSLAALDGISDYAATAQAENTFHTYHADQPGIVVYSTDGYEGVTTDTFQSSMFDEASYDRTDGQRALQVAAGAPLYKLITSEYWSLVIPIGSDLAKRLADDDTLQLRFMKDNTTTYATYTITEKEGSTYLILTLRSGMVRYAKDRYAEVELLLSEETGLRCV